MAPSPISVVRTWARRPGFSSLRGRRILAVVATRAVNWSFLPVGQDLRLGRCGGGKWVTWGQGAELDTAVATTVRVRALRRIGLSWVGSGGGHAGLLGRSRAEPVGTYGMASRAGRAGGIAGYGHLLEDHALQIEHEKPIVQWFAPARHNLDRLHGREAANRPGDRSKYGEAQGLPLRVAVPNPTRQARRFAGSNNAHLALRAIHGCLHHRHPQLDAEPVE